MTQTYETHVQKIENLPNGELADTVASQCSFCEKLVTTSTEYFLFYKKFGHDKFFCPFCLRHQFYQKHAKNQLLLSFKGIIGYYYICLYYDEHRRKLYKNQLADLITNHVKIGLVNPVFAYDPETFLWFVDFNRVGTSKHKVPVEEVHFTVEQIIESFRMKELVPQVDDDKFADKFADAVTQFYETRHRPKDKRILVPTFLNCGVTEQIDFETTKMITPVYFNSHLTNNSGMSINTTSKEAQLKKKGESLMSNLVVSVSKASQKGGPEGFAGRVTIPGLASTKLSRQDGGTFFATRSALTTVARSLGKRLGLTVQFDEPQKAAAKKTKTSVKKKSSKSKSKSKSKAKQSKKKVTPSPSKAKKAPAKKKQAVKKVPVKKAATPPTAKKPAAKKPASKSKAKSTKKSK